MGLPHLDFRVPEPGWFKADWFKAALERVQFGPMLSSSGSLSLPYKIAIVAVMALVACGTLVTFGTAGAETGGAASETAALPGTDEASPQVQGQVLPPTQSLLTSQDLLSTLNLTDYSPQDTTTTAAADSDDESDDDSDDNKKSTSRKSTRPTPKPTTKATTAPTPAKTTSPAPAPTKTTAPPPSPPATQDPPDDSDSDDPPKCTSGQLLAIKAGLKPNCTP